MTRHETMRRLRKLRHSAALGLLLFFPVSAAYAYSVLTHEAIIDSTWDSAIKPLLELGLYLQPARAPVESPRPTGHAGNAPQCSFCNGGNASALRANLGIAPGAEATG